MFVYAPSFEARSATKKQDCIWCALCCSTDFSRCSLLSECHMVSQHMSKWNFTLVIRKVQHPRT